LISEASHVVVASSGHNYSSRSFFSSAREVPVLRMCHLLIRLMMQDGQCFMGCLSHTSLECPPWSRGLNYLVDAPDMISHRPLVDHHTYTPEVRLSSQQPRVPMKSGACWNPVLEARSVEASESSQHPGHRCGTPWAQRPYVVALGHASLPSASSLPSREG
jgi:hypothetical protein